MSEKTFILSSSGIKNLVFNSQQEDEFKFIFNESTISMKSALAEFISPKVSKLHQTDPTTKTISFNDQLQCVTVSDDILSKLKLLSSGDSISINESESFQLKIISILLDNEELCFYFNQKSPSTSTNDANGRYAKKGNQISYIGNPFEGIIDHLTKKSGGNVYDNGTVKVTSSSQSNTGRATKNSIDLHNSQNYFQSNSYTNSWLKYDFINEKVHPTHYSIRTRHDYGGSHSPRNWVIEGTNVDSNNDNDWKKLDSRQNDTFLEGANAVHTYKISENIGENESYRYLRLRQTGPNSSGTNEITLSALEFFGTVIH